MVTWMRMTLVATLRVCKCPLRLEHERRTGMYDEAGYKYADGIGALGDHGFASSSDTCISWD